MTSLRVAESGGGGENDSPREESVCIEMTSQTTKKGTNPELDKDFRVKYKELGRERKFLAHYRKLDDKDPEKESTDKESIQKKKSIQKSPCEGYSLSEKYIGTAIIINNLDHEQPATRADVERLSEPLKKIGFQTHVYLNCTKQEMNELRENVILKEKTHEHSSSFILAVIAHGKEDNRDRNVMTTDGRIGWNMKKVEKQLNGVKMLKGKPKIIIVEACRGERKMKITTEIHVPDGAVALMATQGSDAVLDSEDEDEDDYGDENEGEGNENCIEEKNQSGNRTQLIPYSSSESNRSKHADMKDQMVCFATVQNYVALTLTKSGSAYIQRFAKSFRELMYLEPFTEILNQVTNNLANNPVLEQRELYQVPQYMSTFDKQFNIANYLIEKTRDMTEPMKGHIYLKSISKKSIIGRGYNIPKNQLKHYNIFETHQYVPEYEFQQGEKEKEIYLFPNGVKLIRESTGQSFLEYMRNPTKKDGMATITFHKEFRTAHISFGDNCCCNGKTFSQTFLCEDSKFSDHFKNSLKSDVVIENSKELTEKHLEDFFDFYDNNFVVCHYMGGSVTVTILVNAKSKMLNNAIKEEEILKDYMDKLFSGTAMNGEEMHEDLIVANIDFQGGIIEDVPENFDQITQSQISTWIESIQTNPIPLITEMTLSPIHLAVAEVDSQKGKLIMKEERNRRNEEKIKEGSKTNEGRESCFLYINKTMDADTILPENTEICGNKLVKYIGDMENSEMHGNGRGYFKNGDVYLGQWRTGKPEGLGTWYYKEGKHIFHMRGIFKDGEKLDLLSGEPKKKIYEKRSSWFKLLTSIFALFATGAIIGQVLRPQPLTCTQRIVEEWENIYYINEQSFTWSRAFMKFEMSSLSQDTQSSCNGTTVFIDDLNFSSDLSCPTIGIPKDDSPSRVYEFNFPEHLTSGLIPHPHGDKQFRIRSCKDGTKCRTNLANSKDFICIHNNRTKFRNLTCPESVIYNWEKLSDYNKTSATLRVDLTNLTDKCHHGDQPIYMEVTAVDKEHSWVDCHDITNGKDTIAFSQVFKFNNNTEIQKIKFFSGQFIIRFKQGGGLCGRDHKVSNCKYYECTSMLIHQDQEENHIFKVWRNTENNTNKPNPKKKGDPSLGIILENSAKCTLNLKKIPLYQVFINTSNLTAQVNFTQMNKTDTKYQLNKTENSREESIWVAESSTYINFTQIYQVEANSSYNLTIRPNYPFCGQQDTEKKCECYYQAIFECSNCMCSIKNSELPYECFVITDKSHGPYPFPGYHQIYPNPAEI